MEAARNRGRHRRRRQVSGSTGSRGGSARGSERCGGIQRGSQIRPLAAGGPNPQERLELAIAKGWLWKHESGTYVKFTPAGAELFA